MTANRKAELEAILLTCDGRGKEAKKEALLELQRAAGFEALKDSELMRACVNRLIDLNCPHCHQRIGTTLEI